MKIRQKIEIGDEVHFIEVQQKGSGDDTYIDTAEVIHAQRALALTLLRTRKSSSEIGPEHINFLLNICGMKIREVAKYLSINPALLSQWRKDKGISDIGWLALRIFFINLFSHDAITLEVLQANYSEAA